MPRDYAKRSQPKQKKRHFPWRSLLLLCIILVLLFVIILIAQHVSSEPSHAKPQEPLAVVEKPKAPVIDLEPSNPIEHPAKPYAVKFDFYQLLPNQKVKVPANTNGKAKLPTYLLQIASLKDKTQAEDFQTKLRSQGFDVKIVNVQQGSQLWYRLQMGPFKYLTKAQALFDELQKKNISSIIVTLHPH